MTHPRANPLCSGRLGIRLVRDKPHHPLGYGTAVVVLGQAGHTLLVDLFAEKLLANVQQCPRIVMDELGVALETTTPDR